MYSFIVLGIIPGTDIQITFTTWLNATLLLVASVLVYRLYQLVLAPAYQASNSRQPLFAQQLHSRSI